MGWPVTAAAAAGPVVPGRAGSGLNERPGSGLDRNRAVGRSGGDASVTPISAGRRPRGGHLSMSRDTCLRAGGLSPVRFRIWVALALGSRAGQCSIPRSWVLERAGLAVTPDTLKKLPGHLEAIEDAGLITKAVEGRQVKVRLSAAGGSSGAWHSLLPRVLFDRAVDPSDPLTPAALQAYVCRWLPVLRGDRVQLSQPELARRWGIARTRVQAESALLNRVGLLTVRRCGAASVISDTRLGPLEHSPAPALQKLPAAPETGSDRAVDNAPTADQHRLGSGTGIVRVLAPGPRISLSTARAGVSRRKSLDTDPVVSSRSDDQLAAVRGQRRTGAGPGTRFQPKTTTPGWRIVCSTRWLASAPLRVRYQLARLLDRSLRRGGPAGLPGLWTVESLTRMVRSADPGETTDQHSRLIRAGLAGLAADAKAGQRGGGISRSDATCRRSAQRPAAGSPGGRGTDRRTAGPVGDRAGDEDEDAAVIAVRVLASLDGAGPGPVADGPAARRSGPVRYGPPSADIAPTVEYLLTLTGRSAKPESALTAAWHRLAGQVSPQEQQLVDAAARYVLATLRHRTPAGTGSRTATVAS